MTVTFIILSHENFYSLKLREEGYSVIDSESLPWENLVKGLLSLYDSVEITSKDVSELVSFFSPPDAVDLEETRRHAHRVKYTESNWFCTLCGVGIVPRIMPCGVYHSETSEGQIFDGFTKHMKSRDHAEHVSKNLSLYFEICFFFLFNKGIFI